jgi:hypothetical protein
MPGFVFDGNIERFIDEYFERFGGRDQDRRDDGRYGCTVGDDGLGRLNRYDHSHAQRNHQPKWRGDHLLLPVRHINIARFFDVFGRCWFRIDAHFGLHGGHWAQSQHLISLSTGGHELSGNVDRRQRILYHSPELVRD